MQREGLVTLQKDNIQRKYVIYNFSDSTSNQKIITSIIYREIQNFVLK